MSTDVIIHFVTSRGADQASNSQVVHAQTGGRLMCIDGSRRGADPFVAGATAFSPRQLADAFAASMAATQGGLIEVRPAHSAAVIKFMKERPGTLESIRSVLVSVSPDEPSQQQTVSIIDELVEAGMNGGQLRLIFSGTCQGDRMDDAFAHVLDRLRSTQFPYCTQEAVFCGSRLIEDAREHQLPLALVLNQVIDFEAELEFARNSGLEESVLTRLAHQVLAQRSLLAAQADIKAFVGKLRLSSAVGKEWLHQMERAWRLSKPAPPVPAQSGDPGYSHLEDAQEEPSVIER